jgi:methionyl aminopeptidase
VIALRTAGEIDAIAAAGTILGKLHEELGHHVAPGIATSELDRMAEEYIRAHAGAEPAFKGLYGFPASLCISINEEVVHGIPSPRKFLREGDIVSIDAGVKLDGWFADAAQTHTVGAVDPAARRLVDVTRSALSAGINEARAGRRLGDIGHAVQTAAESAGFSVVRALVGHGIGRDPHEEPQVPNFGRRGRGLELRPGLILAIEPMINEGAPGVLTLEDKWTVVTLDRKRSAHFEHTVAVTANGPRVLTASS